MFNLKVRPFGPVSSTRHVIGQVQETSVPQNTLPSAVVISVAVLGLAKHAKQTKLSQSNIVLPNLNSVSIGYISDVLACPLDIFIG